MRCSLISTLLLARNIPPLAREIEIFLSAAGVKVGATFITWSNCLARLFRLRAQSQIKDCNASEFCHRCSFGGQAQLVLQLPKAMCALAQARSQVRALRRAFVSRPGPRQLNTTRRALQPAPGRRRRIILARLGPPDPGRVR